MHHAYVMGWLRLVGSLKLQVSFAEYSLFYRALLQKRPIMLRSLLIVATPQQLGDVDMQQTEEFVNESCIWKHWNIHIG